ncbi:hypothetical protein APA_1546 [Pseudanabaena sp. lw0831]|nr:hypothetical protein APA_1546 [Pseudanabaena sp. lw0831]
MFINIHHKLGDLYRIIDSKIGGVHLLQQFGILFGLFIAWMSLDFVKTINHYILNDRYDNFWGAIGEKSGG